MEIIEKTYTPAFLEKFGQKDENHLNNEALITALESISTLSFPNKKLEDWKYTPLKELQNLDLKLASPQLFNKSELEKYTLPLSNTLNVFFVNGFPLENNYEPTEGLVILNLKEAKEKHSEIFDTYFAKGQKADKDFLYAFNTAYANNGLFVYVKQKANITKNIHLIFINTEAGNIVQARNLIVADKGSKSNFLMSYYSNNNADSFNNIVTEVFVNENAQVNIDKLQQENQNIISVITEDISVKRDANFTINTFAFSGKLLRNNLNIAIEGTNAVANLNGLTLINGKQHVDHHTLVNHIAPNCESNELYKNILDGNSTAVFNGKVYVNQLAQKTNAYQSNANVLLSDAATINSKPELEIYADDVKCSHGSTTGQIDDAALFYLQARGIGKKAAMALLIEAFASDVTNKIENEELKEYILNKTNGFFNK
jgi:Fe-S cluster assembly protein SufD